MGWGVGGVVGVKMEDRWLQKLLLPLQGGELGGDGQKGRKRLERGKRGRQLYGGVVVRLEGEGKR